MLQKWESLLIDRLLGPSDPLVVVDIGARNGPTEATALSPWSATYCFEPNPAEFKKISATPSKTRPQRGSLNVYPAAVCDYSGTTTLNICKRPGATSTLMPNREFLSHFQKDNWSQIAEIVDKIEVPATTLSDFVDTNNVEYVDFLKLDTQGNEHQILSSLGSRIETVSVIKVEAEFLPIYENQSLYFDIGAHLHRHGFELIDIETVPSCRRFHRLDQLNPSAYRLIWGDLIFVRAPTDASDPRLNAKALVLAALGYADLASYVQTLGSNSDATLNSHFDRLCRRWAEPKTRSGLVRAKLERLFGVLMSRYDWKRGQQINRL